MKEEALCQNVVGWKGKMTSATTSKLCRAPNHYAHQHLENNWKKHKLSGHIHQLLVNHTFWVKNFCRCCFIRFLTEKLWIIYLRQWLLHNMKTCKTNISVVWSLSGLGDPECSDSCSERLKVGSPSPNSLDFSSFYPFITRSLGISILDTCNI